MKPVHAVNSISKEKADVKRQVKYTSFEHEMNVGQSTGLPRFLAGYYRASPGLGELASAPEEEELSPVPPISGQGEEFSATAYGLSMEGRTEATYNNSYRTVNTRTTRGSGCEGCSADSCIRVRGRLVSTFNAATAVTLPSLSDYPDLTPCQRQRVRSAISGVLAPHEQQHVRAFKSYNDTVNTPFDMTICREEFDTRISELHASVEEPRRTSAQAASDALDPFVFDVDLECED